MCVGPSLAVFLQFLVHNRNVANLSLLYSYYFVHLNWLNWFHFLILVVVPLVFLIGCMDFFVTFPRYYKDIYVNSFFPHIARIWNSFPAECFPLTYDLNGFKSRVSRHLSSMCSFYIAFLNDFHLSSFSCNSILRSCCSA